jgi:hypothetical protein
MPRFKIVIADPVVAREKEIERHLRHVLRHATPANNVATRRLTRRLRADLEQQIHQQTSGDVHAICDEECPDGLPNCRNCGDPDHADACKAAGHCPDCGTKHGIAPTRILAAHGYRLEEDR